MKAGISLHSVGNKAINTFTKAANENKLIVKLVLGIQLAKTGVQLTVTQKSLA